MSAKIVKLKHIKISLLIIMCIKVSQSLTLKLETQEKSIKPVSQAIIDVIKKFYMTNDIKFDLIIYGKSSNNINDIINEVTKELFLNETPTTLIQVHGNSKLLIYQSAIIFVKSIKHLSFLQNKFKVLLQNSFPKKLKFFVYIEEIKDFHQLEKIMREFQIPHFSHPDLRYFEYFIIEDENSVNLYANVLFTQTKCEEFEQKFLNSFDKNSSQWLEKLEIFDPYDNFYGCMLKFVIHLEEGTAYIEHGEVNGEMNFLELLTAAQVKFGGLIPELINLMAKRTNFTVHYTLYILLENGFEFVGTNNFTPEYSQMFSFTSADKYNHVSLPFSTEDYYYLISYSHCYTNYEKMIFPFDALTWILILFTFGLTFGTILGLNLSSRWVKILIVGRGIQNPAYNALGIFFGISQLKLPKESFCRIILFLYIWFCLMIRTCWQSLMFELMTTDMRKPMPKSIDDLIEMNYTILTPFIFNTSFINEKFFQGKTL